MFQSLKVIGVCAILLGVECCDAMQVEKQGQSNSLKKVEVEVALPEIESSELSDIGNTESSLESPVVTEENQAENIEQEGVKSEEGIQNSSEIEEEISENLTEDPADTGVVLSDPEEVIQQPESLTGEINLVENISTEFISEPEAVNPVKEEQTPEETDLAESNTAPENVHPTDEIPPECITKIEEIASPSEEKNPDESATEIDVVNSGVESGSESEYEKSISIRIMKILTVIKDRSIGFLKRIFNLFF